MTNFDENVNRFLFDSTNSKFKLFSIFRDAKNVFFCIKRDKQFDPFKWKKKLSNEQINTVNKIIGEDILNRFWPESL